MRLSVEALEAYDEVVARYGNDPEPVVRIPAAMALGNKEIGRAACRERVYRFV